jgi:hypothetical protein
MSINLKLLAKTFYTAFLVFVFSVSFATGVYTGDMSSARKMRIKKWNQDKSQVTRNLIQDISSRPLTKYITELQFGFSEIGEQAVQATSLDDAGLPFSSIFTIGYRYTLRYLVELSFFRFPQEHLLYEKGVHVTVADNEALAISLRLSLSGIAVKHDVNTFLKVGVGWMHEAWRSDDLLLLQDLTSKEKLSLGIHDNLGLLFGIGMNWSISRNYGMTTQYTSLMSLGYLPTTSFIGLGLYYRF